MADVKSYTFFPFSLFLTYGGIEQGDKWCVPLQTSGKLSINKCSRVWFHVTLNTINPTVVYWPWVNFMLLTSEHELALIKGVSQFAKNYIVAAAFIYKNNLQIELKYTPPQNTNYVSWYGWSIVMVKGTRYLGRQI